MNANIIQKPVADPGFPVGGRAPVRGGMDLQRGHFLVKMCAITKELGPIGGGVRPARPPPRSANGNLGFCGIQAVLYINGWHN